MTDHQYKVMIVDDIEENRMLLETILEDDFDLSFAASGKECLDSIAGEKPDLILLDITMPDMDGYEVCRKVVVTDCHPPVIFVSALASAEERLAGFEAGGDDYLAKPVDDTELFRKVNKSLENRSENLKLQSSASDAMNIAMEAMVSSSELGMLNQFMRDTAVAKTYAVLGDALLGVMKNFGLNCCLQFRVSGKNLNIACTNDSLEAKLFNKLQGGEKLVDFGARTIVNSEHAAILAKNMPTEDDAKYGRLKDHMSVLIDAVESKVVSLQISLDMSEQRNVMIGDLVEANDHQLSSIRKLLSEREESTKDIMRAVISGVEASLFSLGLDDDQENSLMQMLDAGQDKIENLPDFNNEIEASFLTAKNALISLLSSEH
ncbi:MAG: response regulator [Pseudomonadales bacterium]|nr:response regulator [Pseudomonadales bacterium]